MNLECTAGEVLTQSCGSTRAEHKRRPRRESRREASASCSRTSPTMYRDVQVSREGRKLGVTIHVGDAAPTVRFIAMIGLISFFSGPVGKNDGDGIGKLGERMWLDDVVIHLVFEGGGPVARFIGGCEYLDLHAA